MNLFETLKTAFKVLAGGFTQNTLIILGFVAFIMLAAWCAFSLAFNHTIKFNRSCVSVMTFLKSNALTRENYSKFVSLWENFPNQMKFAWKKYESKKEGVPSDYLKQYESLDTMVLGGIQKQNRSLMRTAIYVVVFFMTIISIAIIGAAGNGTTTKVPLTTTLFADAMIVPLVTMFMLFVVYYIYTNIRNQEYRTACDNFYDLLDVLDERVDLYAIFGTETRTIGLLSAIYKNESMELIDKKLEKERQSKKYQISEVRVGNNKKGLSPLRNGILGVEENEKTEDNVIHTDEIFSNKLSNNENELKLDTGKESNFKIKNEIHFVEVVNCVEVLLNRLETENNLVKKQSIEREVNTLIKALTEYKQKAKAKIGKKGSRKKA